MSRAKKILELALNQKKTEDKPAETFISNDESSIAENLGDDSTDPFETDGDSDPDFVPHSKFLNINAVENKENDQLQLSGPNVGVGVQNLALPIEETSPEFSPLTPKARKSSFKKKSGKKRLSVPAEWERNKIAKLCNSGQAYVNSKGFYVKQRAMKGNCGVECRKKCKNFISEDKRQAIFNKFWKKGSKLQQWNFISKNTKNVPKKTEKQGQQKVVRELVRKYFLNDDSGTDREVCKKMFLNTLNITWKWVETSHLKSCSGIGTLSPDKRGSYQRKENKNVSEIKKDIIAHIKSFPQVESHYRRKKSTKLYIQGEGLNIAKMFRLYEEKYSEKSEIERGSLRQYRDIFNREFNIAFFVPKSDQCNDCTSFQNLDEDLKIENNLHHSEHLQFVKKSRELKEEDKKTATSSEGKIIAACFDFQKVLTCPNSKVNALYYKRKFAGFNFTIFKMCQKEAYCYVWDESLAKKGANEVSSCLMNFIENEVENGCKDFRFWSDNCPGQNKNKILFSAYSLFAFKYKVTITHRFLEKGHTQNEGDSVHARIENEKKGKTVFVPSDWYTLIRNAKVKGKSYKTIEMTQTDFFNYNIFEKTLKKIRANFSKIKEVKVDSDEPYIIQIKYNFEKNEPLKFNLNTFEKERNVKNRGRQKIHTNPYETSLQNTYTSPLPISLKKKNDLLSLCKENHIPKYYHSFYERLQTFDNDSDDSD